MHPLAKLATRLAFAPLPAHVQGAEAAYEAIAKKGAYKEFIVRQPLTNIGSMQIIFAKPHAPRDCHLLVHGRGNGIGAGVEPALHLLARDHAVCLINFPGEQGNSGDINQASVVAAITEALRYLQHKQIDPNEINISAASLGAAMTAVALGLLGRREPEKTWKSFHLYSPPVLERFPEIKTKSTILFRLLNWMLKGKLVEIVSPLKSLELCRDIKAQSAVIHHAQDDPIVPISMGQEYLVALKAATGIKHARLVNYECKEHHRLALHALESNTALF